MHRLSNQPTDRMMMHLPKGELAWIRELAWRNRMTLSQFTRRLVKAGLEAEGFGRAPPGYQPDNEPTNGHADA